MKDWKEIIENKLEKQKNSIAKVNLEKETVIYSEKIKHNRKLNILTGDEEVVDAQNHIDQEIEKYMAKINLIIEEAIRNPAYV